jgi:hypothetical protein
MRDERGQQTFGWSGVRRHAPVPRPQGEELKRVAVPPPAPVSRVQPEPSAPVTAMPSSLPPENELWDVRAAARFLRRSVSWVYHHVEDGTLP